MNIKCVIWDLDNTLWEGTLSENGFVKEKQEIVDLIIEMNHKGIINSICSKNEEALALSQLEKLGLCQLFVLPKINWNKKSENIQLLINQLKLRAENILFIDDSDFELDEVKNKHPQLNILNMKEIEYLKSYLASLTDEMTEETSNRIDFYKLEEQRVVAQLSSKLTDQEFLATCDIQVKMKLAKETDLDRIHELIDRTNQINSSGIRYGKSEIIACIEDSEKEVFIASVKDKYGDYGKSALLITEKDMNRYTVHLLIVSCRLLGKSISQYLLHFAFSRAVSLKKVLFCCEYKQTSSNRKILLLYLLNQMKYQNNKNGMFIYSIQCKNNEITKPIWINQQEERK